MTLSNYHSHCTFCDGRSAPEEFVKFAISKGFRAYGFSSHSPLPFETFWNMSKDDLPEYLQEISRLKEKYDGMIEIYAGLEIDYLDDTYNASIPCFTELPLDYRIGSIHFLPVAGVMREDGMACIDGPYTDYAEAIRKYFNDDIRLFVQRYFESVKRMIEAGGIDIVGHIDKIYMNGIRHEFFSLDEDWYRKPFLECLGMIADRGLIVEVNTKNLIRKGHLYPHERYLTQLKALNIPVMVNSDCHFPDLVNDGRDKAFEIIGAAGYTSVKELVKGKWEDVDI